METFNFNHLDRTSADGTQFNIDALYRIAPSVFTEALDPNTGKVCRKVNFEALRRLLGDDAVEDGGEMYQFTWPGKNAARAEAARPTDQTLRPVPEDSVDWDTTRNIYIEGDNLEVLKLLQKSYLGKVKMIYIDPPYNTGNDFVYHDDFARSQAEEDLFAGNVDELGNRFIKNTDSNGRYHSDWCSMIYSRLMVARSLLSEDGVIFISIDDNEVENLIKICDEIFGESQRLSDIIVKNNPRGRQSDSFVATVHEHLLCYGKDSSRSMLNGMPLSIEQQQDFSYEDENGKYRLLGLRQRGVASLREDRPDMYFPIYVSPDGNSVSLDAKPDWSAVIPKKSDGREGRWMWGKTKCQEDIQRLVPKMIERRNEYDIFVKDYLNREGEVRTRKFQSIWDDNTMNNQVGTQEVGALLGPNIMSFPKSRPYIQQVVQMGADNDSIILDFFSGSSTTAHAVMQLNAEDGGTRKYIMVQLQEETPDKSDARKAGYKNICEIGKERIRRAGRKILELRLESLEKENIIERYARELSEIRSLEEVYGTRGNDLSADEKASTRGVVRPSGSDEKGRGIHTIEHSGGAVEGQQGVYPVFESGKGLTCGTGNTVVDMRTLELLNSFGYRVKLEPAGRNKQNALFPDENIGSETLSSKLSALNSKLSALSTDTGFRVFRLDTSNYELVSKSPKDYKQEQLDLFANNIKADRTDMDLLFGAMLAWGVMLDQPMCKETVDGHAIYTVNDGDLVACFTEGITDKVVKAMADKTPLRVLFRDACFSEDAQKINIYEQFKQLLDWTDDEAMKNIRVI